MSLLDGLISYWKLDEASGNRLDSKSLHTLTSVNSVGSAAGKIGDAASFAAASSQYLEGPSNDTLPTRDQSFSVTAWAYLTAAVANQMVISSWDEATNNRHFQVFAGAFANAWRLTVGTTGASSVAVNSSAVSVNQWVLLCARSEPGGLIQLNVNDANNTTASLGTPTSATKVKLLIGARYNTTPQLFFNGLIDEVGIWNRVLTDAEVTTIYNGGNGLSYGSFGGGIIPILRQHYAAQGAR
jgi:hypothetical protein